VAGARGRSSEAEHQLPKLRTRVRFPSPALPDPRRSHRYSALHPRIAVMHVDAFVPHTCPSVPLEGPRPQLPTLRTACFRAVCSETIDCGLSIGMDSVTSRQGVLRDRADGRQGRSLRHLDRVAGFCFVPVVRITRCQEFAEATDQSARWTPSSNRGLDQEDIRRIVTAMATRPARLAGLIHCHRRWQSAW
jgi:hypothetical protein